MIKNHKVENKVLSTTFTFGIKTLDNHIAMVLDNTEANSAQVSFVALAMYGFILSHGGVKETSMMVLDVSDSGTGKSQNQRLQRNLLLHGITQEQDNLQLLASDDDSGRKRYANVHSGKITKPALYQCIETVPAQLIIVDELGLLLQKDDNIISEVTSLYGETIASIPVLKTEVAAIRSTVPVALSFIGATTLSYFGSTKKLKYHISGGFVNRAFIVYNNVLKSPDEITSIGSQYIDCGPSNQTVLELLSFAKNSSKEFEYNQESRNILLEFKKEIQVIKMEFNSQGNNTYAFLYNRIFQNTKIVINILHSLKCFEIKKDSVVIDTGTVKTAISFVKELVYKEIDKLINYLSDDELLKNEEKHKEKIRKFVDDFYNLNSQMPKIRDVCQKTRLSKSYILELTKDYLQIVPGTTVFQYCCTTDGVVL